MGRIATEHWIPADLTRVFAFFSNPQNLPRIMPAKMAVRLEKLRLRRVEDHSVCKVVESGIDLAGVAGPGSLIEISFRLVPFLPLRGTWISEILEYEPLAYFVDIQRTGPMKTWRHRHSFRGESRNGISGTVIRDEVEYELPMGALANAFDMLLIQRMIQGTFASRQRELERIFA